MTHRDAVEQMMVERYLLGELAGDARLQFEEHLFDCMECTSDLKGGVAFLDGARQELRSTRRTAASARLNATSKPPTLAWLWKPWVLGPALAACLAVMVYQTAVVIPGLRNGAAGKGETVATMEAPRLLEPHVLANAGARGDSNAVPEITASRHGSYVLSVDIPPAPGALRYRCSLIAASGATVWQLDVSPEQARDAVTIQVPVMTADQGMNELRVQSLSASGPGGETLTPLASYRYKLHVTE